MWLWKNLTPAPCQSILTSSLDLAQKTNDTGYGNYRLVCNRPAYFVFPKPYKKKIRLIQNSIKKGIHEEREIGWDRYFLLTSGQESDR